MTVTFSSPVYAPQLWFTSFIVLNGKGNVINDNALSNSSDDYDRCKRLAFAWEDIKFLTVNGAIQPVDLNPVLFPATHDPVIARRQSHVATVKARLKPIAVCDSVIINTAKGLSPERDVNVGAYSIDATGVVTFTPLVNFVGTAPAATV